MKILELEALGSFPSGGLWVGLGVEDPWPPGHWRCGGGGIKSDGRLREDRAAAQGFWAHSQQPRPQGYKLSLTNYGSLWVYCIY